MEAQGKQNDCTVLRKRNKKGIILIPSCWNASPKIDTLKLMNPCNFSRWICRCGTIGGLCPLCTLGTSFVLYLCSQTPQCFTSQMVCTLVHGFAWGMIPQYLKRSHGCESTGHCLGVVVWVLQCALSWAVNRTATTPLHSSCFPIKVMSKSIGNQLLNTGLVPIPPPVVPVVTWEAPQWYKHKPILLPLLPIP